MVTSQVKEINDVVSAFDATDHVVCGWRCDPEGSWHLSVDAHEIYVDVGFVPCPDPQNLTMLDTQGQR